MNDEFYMIVRSFFHRLEEGLGTGEESREFAVRLIGRTLFCWFLKMKKSENGKSLLPESLLSSRAVKAHENYHDTILTCLFFKVLNTPVDQRSGDVPQWAEEIPFLNSALFLDPASDFNKAPEHQFGPILLDQWFYDFFLELEKCQFTLEEYSPGGSGKEIGPERLGHILEQLLAVIDHPGGKSTRQTTGSFYTPREIVDHMVCKSLVQYLHNKTRLGHEHLGLLFKEAKEKLPDISPEESNNIREALENIKILDPACGAGIFPIRCLRQIVLALEKLYPDGYERNKRQSNQLTEPSPQQQLAEEFEEAGPVFPKKLGVMQHSLYGIDIQPLATEFTKLRCSLSLIGDEELDDEKVNRGLSFLPGLEFNFVASNALLTSPKDLFGVDAFDVIIGNPPYIKEPTNPTAFDGIRGKKYYQGKMDIWYYFACHFLDMLTEDGNLTFIATNNWVTNAGASKLRNKVATDGKIIQLLDFGDASLFDSASIQTMILMAERNSRDDQYAFEYKKIEDSSTSFQDALDMLKGVEKSGVLHFHPIFNRQAYLRQAFLFQPPEVEVLLARIKAKQNFVLDPQLEVAQGIVPNPDVVNARNIGLIPKQKRTQYKIEPGDGVFVVDQQKAESIDDEGSRYLIPLYEPHKVEKQYLPKTDKYILYLKKGLYQGDSPQLEQHLSRYREIMEQRRENRNGRLEFYHLHWPRDPYFFERGEKILAVRKCAEPTFVYATREAAVMMAFNVIRSDRIDLKYLSALLNSSLVRFWLKHRGKMQGSNFQVDKEPLVHIPIYKPESTAIFSRMVDYVMVAKAYRNHNHSPEPNEKIAKGFEEVLDAMVLQLYFKEEFEGAGLSFVELANDHFVAIEGKSEKEQIAIVLENYLMLKEVGNPIQSMLNSLDDLLPHIMGLIGSAKK